MRDEKGVGCPGDVREMGEGGRGLGGGVGWGVGWGWGGIKAMMTVLYCRFFDQSLTLPYICSVEKGGGGRQNTRSAKRQKEWKH